MAKFNSINQLLLLALIFSMTKMTYGQGRLLVSLLEYQEKAKDTTTKCIKLCVTTSLSGFPRCNLNATTDTTITHFFSGYTSYPVIIEYNFNFTQWEDNSELSITVWNNPSEQKCDTSAPTNITYHGEAGIIIPRFEKEKYRFIVSDKWKLRVRTKLICENHGCIEPCVPRDNSTGHYTCVDNNKKCLENWFNLNKNCTKYCNNSAARYKCNDKGDKVCLKNWFNVHENCTTYCNVNSSTYKCTKNGSKICNPSYFGRDCDIFCDRNATNYKCDEKGRRTCLANWYNKNCEQFCDSSKGNYLCDNEGHRVCLLHWYGKNCTKYCNNSAARYKCNDKGDSVCSRNWYGSNCSKFCDNSNEHFKCNPDGDKVCLKNWYGKNCGKYCNNSATHFRCNDEGDKACLKDWYGPDCSKFCDNNKKNFKCNTDGDKICMPNWYGKNCTVFCNNTAALSDGKIVRYFCDKNGQKTCIENRYGPQCKLHCTAVMAEPLETNSEHEQSDIGLYYCEIEEGIEQENIRCPKGWKDTNCLLGCHDQNTSEFVKKFRTKCDGKNGRALLCSSNTITEKECDWNGNPLEQRANKQKSSRKNMSDVKLYGGLFGALMLMVVITTIVVVYISLKKKKQASTSPIYETPRAMNNDIFAREFNRAEMTFTVDDFMRRRQSSADELGYDNEGMMVENPLYKRNMRAAVPFKPSPVTCSTASPEDVFAMSNTTV